jgi:site-specific DNA-methyltransferase (adenine-specific)
LKGAPRGHKPPPALDLEDAVLAAYRGTCEDVPVDQLLADPQRNAAFVEACRHKARYGDAVLWNRTLLSLRKRGKLARPEKRLLGARPSKTDSYRFGSEVAMHQLSVECGLSLDEVLCDPRLAARFDETAAAFAPGFAPREYRWAALSLRKCAHDAKKAARKLLFAQPRLRLPRPKPFVPKSWQHLAGPGVYVLEGPGGQAMYVGETLDLKARLDATSRIPAWTRLGLESVRVLANPPSRHGLQSWLIGRLRPLLNSRLLALEPEAVRS